MSQTGSLEAVASDQASFLLPADADTGILADFIAEANEHLEASDLHLLTLETDAGNRDLLDAVFRAFHSIKGVAGFLGLDGIKVLSHEAENMLDKIRNGEIPLQGPVMDCVFDSVTFLKGAIADLRKGVNDEDDARSREASSALRTRIRALLSGQEPAKTGAGEGEPLASASAPATGPAPAAVRLGDILVAAGDLAPESLAEALKEQADPAPRKLGDVLVETGRADAKQVAQALRVQKGAAAPGIAAVKETVKVDAERLDRLLDTIGELVIAESMIQGSPELKGRVSPKLVQQMGQLDKITRELQEMGTSLRMVPVRPTFQKMARLVRDLSKNSGKAVNFLTVGEETELDKTVVEKIGDPLVHMIRNSLDHGIESDPQDRIRSGKPATATVKLSAFQKGGNVCIEISDDGKGLNRDAILSKARERGLIKEDANPTDKEVWGYIFEAGFSTAKQVTELSGRGVGMDVVKRNIEILRGRIDIHSVPGQGTTFSIWLPLTLAIIDGMVVRISDERYVFPTLSIVRIVSYLEKDRLTVKGKGEMLSVQGELVPFFPLKDYFQPDGGRSAQAARLIVIAESEGRRAAFPVDELLGQQQIVIKKLETAFQNIPGLSGGAILSDGCVGLILDMDGLMKLGF
ncbi:MAG: CheA signal transduction histidine kinase [Fibrobacteres bacterium]|nr:CheA signal transduction histidine kinase [Fibrobacterota bacterium]